MTHQYVGAYYVPHGWYENYDPGFQYDPLSTVFYKNAWYILKQPAPVGTEPTNNVYWAQYNMVPGQINDIMGRLDNIEDDIDILSSKQIKCVFPQVTMDSDPEGTCFFINGDKVGLFDCSRAENSQDIINALNNNGINHIDYVVISHYHYDHVGSLTKLTNFINDRTTFYLPLSVDKYPDTTAALNLILQTFPNSNFIYPSENSSYSEGRTLLTFYNCGQNVISYYNTLSNASYNDYSMVTTININNSVIVYPGDIQDQGQKRLYDNSLYSPCNLLVCPHHSADSSGNINLALSYNPQYMFISDNTLLSKNDGQKSSFVGAIASTGTVIFRASSQVKSAVFNITSGGIVPDAISRYETSGHNGNNLTYYVDSSYNGLSNGSINSPFKSIQEATAFLHPQLVTTIVLLSDVTEPLILNGKNNVVLNIRTPLSYNLTISRCSNVSVNFNNNTAKAVILLSSSNVRVANGTIEGLNADEVTGGLSNLHSNSAFTANVAFRINKSCMVLSDLFSSYTGTIISATFSIISYSSPINNFTQTSKILNAVNTVVNMQATNETNLTKIFGVSGIPHLVYNNSINKAGILINGTYKYFTTE